MSAFISDRTYNSIQLEIDKVDPIFSEMWRTQPRLELSDEVATAGLAFGDSSAFIIADPTYWKRLKLQDKVFVVCHEYSHLIFCHWIKRPTEWENIAQDIQVNEFLERRYGLRPPKDACTLEMVFKEKSYKVKRDQNYLYYLDLIMKCLPPSERG